MGCFPGASTFSCCTTSKPQWTWSLLLLFRSIIAHFASWRLQHFYPSSPISIPNSISATARLHLPIFCFLILSLRLYAVDDQANGVFTIVLCYNGCTWCAAHLPRALLPLFCEGSFQNIRYLDCYLSLPIIAQVWRSLCRCRTAQANGSVSIFWTRTRIIINFMIRTSFTETSNCSNILHSAERLIPSYIVDFLVESYL